MRKVFSLNVAIAALALCPASDAATLEFSYTFVSGETLSGTVEGNRDGDLGEGLFWNLRNLNAVYSGLPTVTFTYLYWFGNFNLDGRGGMSFEGFRDELSTSTPTPNLGFSITPQRDTPPIISVGAWTVAVNSIDYTVPGPYYEQWQRFDPERWTAQVVPEPSTWIVVASGTVCMLLRRKRTIARR